MIPYVMRTRYLVKWKSCRVGKIFQTQNKKTSYFVAYDCNQSHLNKHKHKKNNAK